MDYREVRKREKIKKHGGDTSGRELSSPKRVDYGRRRSIAVMLVLLAVVLALGAAVLKVNNVGILPAAPTAEPKTADNGDALNNDVLTDGSGNALPTVEPPNTYSLD